MSRASMILLLWAAAVSVRAQPVEKPCTVEGQVIHIATGEPLNKVNLALRNVANLRAAYSARSDAAGRFVFDSVEPGRYRLSAERVGFLQQDYSARGGMSSQTSLTLSPGQKLDGVVFKLTPQGVITGSVLDEDGDPLPGVSVQLLRRRYQEGERRLAPAGGASTNDIGEYRLAQIKPGRYYIVASARPSGLRSRFSRIVTPRASEESYVPTFYPGTTEAANATPIEVGAGSQLQGMDIRLEKTQVVSVRGKLVDGSDNTPVRNVVVVLTPRGSGIVGSLNRKTSVVLGPEGTFEVHGVPRGSYFLTVNPIQRGRDSQRGVAGQVLEVGDTDIDGLVVTLREPLELSGVVRMENDEPFQPRGIQVSLAATEGAPEARASGRAEADSSFTLTNLMPAKYRLAVHGLPGGTYLKSARLGNQDVLEAGVDLSAGLLPGALQLTLSAAAAEITGRVVQSDQQPAAGVTVTLVPEPERRTQTYLFKTAGTDQNGVFRFTGIAPGDYQLYAWEEIESGAHQDPEFVAPFESEAASVSLRENSMETVQLEMIPAEAIEAR